MKGYRDDDDDDDCLEAGSTQREQKVEHRAKSMEQAARRCRRPRTSEDEPRRCGVCHCGVKSRDGSKVYKQILRRKETEGV